MEMIEQKGDRAGGWGTEHGVIEILKSFACNNAGRVDSFAQFLND